MASRAVIGIAAGPSETLMAQVIADLFYVHERGFWMGVFFGSLSLGAFIGPVISGNIAQRYGWRSFFWLSIDLIAFDLILILFFLSETKYNRAEQGQSQGATTMSSTIQDTDAAPDHPHEKESTSSNHVESISPSSVTVRGQGRPNFRQYLLIQKPHRQWKQFLIHDFVVPIRVTSFPIVLFAALNVMGAANMVLFWNLTESDILSPSPYNFSTSTVGFANFGFAGGSILGMATAGAFSDWVVKRATVRNKGIREAEMRLPALIPFAIATIIGAIVGGIAVQHSWPWPVLVCLGYGAAGLGMTTVPAIAVAYAVDAYKPVAGEIMAVATVFKNTTGFSMSYWVLPMAEKSGYITPLMVWFVFTVVPMLLAVPLYFWGKRLRIATRNSVMHKYEDII